MGEGERAWVGVVEERVMDDSMLRVWMLLWQTSVEARHERFVSVSVPRPTLPSNVNGLGPGGEGGDNRPT